MATNQNMGPEAQWKASYETLLTEILDLIPEECRGLVRENPKLPVAEVVTLGRALSLIEPPSRPLREMSVQPTAPREHRVRVRQWLQVQNEWFWSTLDRAGESKSGMMAFLMESLTELLEAMLLGETPEIVHDLRHRAGWAIRIRGDMDALAVVCAAARREAEGTWREELRDIDAAGQELVERLKGRFQVADPLLEALAEAHQGMGWWQDYRLYPALQVPGVDLEPEEEEEEED